MGKRSLLPFFLVIVILFSGCISTEKPKVGSKEVDFSAPYNIQQDEIGFTVDSSVSVPINNTRDSKVKIKISDSRIIAVYQNGKRERVDGTTNSIIIGPHRKKKLDVNFVGIPVKYELMSEPLRLHPLIKSYRINVKYKATTKVFFNLIPWSEKGEYEEIIKLQDREVNISQFIGKDFI